MRDIFDFGDTKDVKLIIRKVAELFDFPVLQFETEVQGNSKLKDAILKHDISFYEDAIQKITVLCEETRFFEQAKLQRIVFGGSDISSDEIGDMCERMNDMYYR